MSYKDIYGPIGTHGGGRTLSHPVSSLLFLDHPTLEPRHFIEDKVINEHYPDYMFLECIKFINEVRLAYGPLCRSQQINVNKFVCFQNRIASVRE